MRGIVVGLLLGASTAACDSSIADPLPLEVAITASRTIAAPGDSISLVVEAQGGSLIGLEMFFGDGGTDLYGTSGARTARVTFRYAYAAIGIYTARVVVTDAVAGQKDASIEIRVQ